MTEKDEQIIGRPDFKSALEDEPPEIGFDVFSIFSYQDTPHQNSRNDEK
jgi:hypothetical protein